MNKLTTFRNIVNGLVVGSLLYACTSNNKVADKMQHIAVPKVASNQTIILHPDYLNGKVEVGYTLLTDIDSDGTWDAAEYLHIPKSGLYATPPTVHKLYYKKGFGPAQSVSPAIPLRFVDKEFFKPYE